MDFVKDHEELYDKTNTHFKDKAREDCLRERFENSSKLSVKVSKTWSIPKGLAVENTSSSSLATSPRK